jgi:hypothetical protein
LTQLRQRRHQMHKNTYRFDKGQIPVIDRKILLLIRLIIAGRFACFLS